MTLHLAAIIALSALFLLLALFTGYTSIFLSWNLRELDSKEKTLFSIIIMVGFTAMCSCGWLLCHLLTMKS